MGATGSLRTRLLAAFLLPTLLLLAGVGAAGYRASRAVLEDELGASLSGVAGVVASQLSAERVLALTAEDATGEGSRVWRRLSRELDTARTAADARRVVVFDLQGVVRLDSGGGLPPGAPLPELARDRLELTRVFGGARGFSQVLFEGTDGRYYKTGYAPLRDEAGAVVGAVAVEGGATFFSPLRRLFQAYGLLALATLLVLATAAVLTSRALSRPLERLVDAALRIGRGDLETAVRPEATREIGILARELDAMRAALLARDRQLKLMLGGVAHEVKNPLGGIELFAGLLNEELASERPALDDARSHVEKIRRELDYLKRLVDDFLVFAREQKLQRARFPAPELLEAAAAHLGGEAAKRGVALQVDAAPATLDADLSLLTAALVNLTRNAVQASPDGGTVALRGRAEGGRYAVEVLDAGAGIPADKLPHIFEPFFTTREKGSGLGLPLARKLAEAHGGTVSVESRPGQTCFRLELPLAG